MADFKGKYLQLKEAGQVNAYPSGFYNARLNQIIEENDNALVAADRLEGPAIPDQSIILEAGVLGLPGINVTLVDSDGVTPINIGDKVAKNEGFFFVVDGAVAVDSKIYLKYSQN